MAWIGTGSFYGLVTVLAVWQGWLGLSAMAMAVWLYLWALHGGTVRPFWRVTLAEDCAPPRDRRPDGAWPRICAVIPARDEADVIGAALASLIGQDYSGPLRLIVVDDGSADGTKAAALAEAEKSAASATGRSVAVIEAGPRPAGWAGKVWAMREGLAAADADPGARPDYVLFTDADIVHPADGLTRLVSLAEAHNLDLVSLMVRLRCRGFWEVLLIPAFVFFFRMLYPFASVNDPRRRIAAAAGGIMLARRDAVARVGGLAAIRGALIDDCALARKLKGQGRIWLGQSGAARSIRGYDGLGGIWRMVARSAYDQLGYSAALLCLTLGGMALVFVVPPLAVMAGLAGWAGPGAMALGLVAWAIMARCYLPMVRAYDLNAVIAGILPIVALLFSAMSWESAYRHWRGRGGAWKARHYRPGEGAVN